MAGKISKWQDRLLDLGKRNKLLFFKPAANASLEVLSPGADVFFDKLTSKSSFEIFDLDGKCEANKGGKIIDRNAAIEFFGKRIKAKEVLLHSPGKPVAEILKTLHKRNREFFTERGINILYAAFGFMEWKDKQGDANYSPLLLVPVALSKTGANKPYILELFEDETIVNPALKYKLSSEFKIDLPEMSDSDSVTTYINKSAALLGNLAKISGRAEISLFYYNKVNMYLDLKNNAKVIEKNINVRALLGEGMLPQPVSGFSKRQHNVVDADASQSEAIAFAKTGESFVLQGPPGTGKSQTITNLIAEYLAAGKKVLFVSEKLAALQVVYNNLKKVGLEDYALELHSHKANKKDAIEELSRTLCLPAKNLSKRALEEEDTLASVSSKLAKYADFLHTETKLGTPFFMIDSLSDFDDKDFSYIFRDISIFDRAKLKRAEELLDNYSGYSGTIGADYRKYPWYGYKGGTDYQSRLRLKEQVKSAADGANALMKASG